MTTAVSPAAYDAAKYAGRTMTKAEFMRWESDDNYVYEYNHGLLEPTESRRQEELLLFRQLTRRFIQTDAFRQRGELAAEIDVWLTDKQMRRPHAAFYTSEQLRQIAEADVVVPFFVVGFASESDSEQKSSQKRHEYFDAGVQVVWWVFPAYKEVFVYTSPKHVTICTDDDRLSAAPALPNFSLTVADLFTRL